MDPMVWIVIGVIALIVVIALIALAARNSNRKKLTEAAELRRDARDREHQLERQDAVAREQEHRAGAAEQEAKAKAAEAERLRADAEKHRGALDDQKRDVSRMEQTAEKLDPRHRADEHARDRDRKHDHAHDHDHDHDRDHGRGPGRGRHAVADDLTPGDRTGATPGERGLTDPAPTDRGIADRPGGGGTLGRHATPDDAAGLAAPGDSAEHGGPGPSGSHTGRGRGVADKLLGRDHPDEPRR